MTYDEAMKLACAVRDALPESVRVRLKAIDVAPKLHQGMITLRVYAVNQTAPDPTPFIFRVEELS